MSAEEVAPVADRLEAAVKRPMAALSADDRRFWIGVICALLLHAALIFGFTRSYNGAYDRPPLGDRSGSADGISVEIIDAADLLSRETVALPSELPPAKVAEPQPQPQPEKPTPQPQAAPPPPPKEVTASAIEEQIPDLYALPKLLPKQSESKSSANGKPAPKSQQDASLRAKAPDAASAFGGRSAAFARPPGITRSGENDDFGRGVIRALRQTMPAPNGVLGRVTIRFLLSDTGNMVEVQVVRGSGDAMLDRSVMFASKQSSFPLPPRGSTTDDRTFLVTYIYN